MLVFLLVGEFVEGCYIIKKKERIEGPVMIGCHRPKVLSKI